MKIVFSVVLAALVSGAPAAWTQDAVFRLPKSAPHAEPVNFGKFGNVYIYRAKPEPDNFVLFISGDGGWNLGVVGMAQQIAAQDATVVGIDVVAFRKALNAAKGECAYPAADFESLSQFVQKKLGFKTYHRPTLIGYSSGATLAYALLGQAPIGTFLGAVSLGFCPELENVKSFCTTNGLTFSPEPKHHGIVLAPMTQIRQPFVALQGEQDVVCAPQTTKDFVAKISTGEVVMLPMVGHGFSRPQNWLSQYLSAYQKVIQDGAATRASTTPAPASPSAPATPASIAGLPVIEIPAAKPGGDTFAILLTGDGGWAGIDQQVSHSLADAGVPVAALDSLSYFWTKRSPAETANAVAAMIDHYSALWQKSGVILVGYSFGADVLPFVATRLSERQRQQLRLITLLGLSGKAEFEFHVGDWLGISSAAVLPTEPELRKLQGVKALCIFGEGETDTLCPKLNMAWIQPLQIGEGHHFGGDYGAIAKDILAAAGSH